MHVLYSMFVWFIHMYVCMLVSSTKKCKSIVGPTTLFVLNVCVCVNANT